MYILMASNCEYAGLNLLNALNDLWSAHSDVWQKNPDGSEYIGKVRPGYSVRPVSVHLAHTPTHTKACTTQVFPDWFAKNVDSFWTEALSNWSKSGVEFSGIWLDMNEASSFCVGSW